MRSAPAESQVGICTPLVTWLTGTSQDGQRGKSGWKIRRLTSPCRRLTAMRHGRAALRQKRHVERLVGIVVDWHGRAPGCLSSLTPRPASRPFDVRQIFAQEVGGEPVEAGGHGRVRGENIARLSSPTTLPEIEIGLQRQMAGALDDREGGVTLVDVADLDFGMEGFHHAPAADAENDLLHQAHFRSAAV